MADQRLVMLAALATSGASGGRPVVLTVIVGGQAVVGEVCSAADYMTALTGGRGWQESPADQHYLHLRRARLAGTAVKVHATRPASWRIDLEHVDAWSLGDATEY